jgi:hypothetical protein
MKSNWERSKSKSTYHFDPKQIDPSETAIQYLGNIKPTWLEDLTDMIDNSRPATWALLGASDNKSSLPQDLTSAPKSDLASKEFDLTNNGMSKDMVLTNLNWHIPDSLRRISDAVGLQDGMDRVHVQMPGDIWNLHIDKLQRWNPDNPETVMRIMIQLTDWQPGQFWEYGNYHYNHWRAGDVTTFDWINMPHCTANAGYNPRITFQLTGIRTGKTMDWLAQLPA